MNKKKFISLIISIAIDLVAWCVPPDTFGIPNLTVVEQRVIALFLFAVAMWITEAIPIWTTSVLIIVLMLLSISTSSIYFFRPSSDNPAFLETFGTLIDYKVIMATFADPIIMLFMGGFVLAIAASKYKLDAGLAKVLLKPFGTKSENVLLGFLLVTATFSMFMSNTATAAMMLAILSPVLASLPTEGKGRIALALAIPVAANVGGIGSPIGTPPNAIALKYISDSGINISFGQWMLFMVPLSLIILFVAWLSLKKMFPFTQKNIKIEITGTFEKTPKAWIVYITFILTLLLWISDKFTGINADVVALIPFAVFSVTKVITREDLKLIDWDVLWLVAGGFALGVGLEDTGLAKHVVETIPFGSWSPLLMMLGAGLLCYLMSTFISNTATAALLIPILTVAGTEMQNELAVFGGVPSLLLGVALSASLAMALPISTPPNALAYAKGFIKQKEMAALGIVIGLVGLALSYAMLILFGKYWM